MLRWPDYLVILSRLGRGIAIYLPNLNNYMVVVDKPSHPTGMCPPGMWKCVSGDCIMQGAYCDGYSDC